MSEDYFARCAAAAYDTWEREYRRCKREASNSTDPYARVPLCSHHADVITVNAVLPLREALQDARKQLEGLELALELQRLDEHLAWRNRVKEETAVYFMRCQQFVKIGSSRNPGYRLQQISTTGGVRSPRGIDLAQTSLIATEPGGVERERELHKRFKHLRHTGEWFTEAPELTDYIKGLAA